MISKTSPRAKTSLRRRELLRKLSAGLSKMESSRRPAMRTAPTSFTSITGRSPITIRPHWPMILMAWQPGWRRLSGEYSKKILLLISALPEW